MNLQEVKQVEAIPVGQRLLVETTQEILVGNLKVFCAETRFLELENVSELKTNLRYSLPQLFPLGSLKSIKIIPNDGDSNNLAVAANSIKGGLSIKTPNAAAYGPQHQRHDVNRSSSSVSSSSSRSQEGTPFMNLRSIELEEMEKHLNSLVYIQQTDQRYHKAVADIKSQSVIGLVVEPSDCGRHKRPSLLAVATTNAVYIFDIIYMGEIFEELKVLLEANRPRKALHCSYKIVDQLKYRHHVELGGMFDTFVAYCLVNGCTEPVTLIEAVEKTFNISKIYFDHKEVDDKHYDPFRRPVSQAQCLITAKKVIFQLKLYEHLLHEQMLSSFYKQCSKYSKTFSKIEDGVELITKLGPNSREGLEHIEPFGDWRDKLQAQFQALDL